MWRIVISKYIYVYMYALENKKLNRNVLRIVELFFSPLFLCLKPNKMGPLCASSNIWAQSRSTSIYLLLKISAKYSLSLIQKIMPKQVL